MDCICIANSALPISFEHRECIFAAYLICVVPDVMFVHISHRVEAVNRSVSVSSWFVDKHIADVLRRSAEMPLLPMLPTLSTAALSLVAENTSLVETSAEAGMRQATEVTVAAVHRLLEGFGGVDIFSRVVRQRYTAVYGALARQQQDAATRQELSSWRELCTPEQRALALRQFGPKNTAAVDAAVLAKKAVFADVGAASTMNAADVAGVRSEMELDEAELTVALLLGDASLLRFFHACA